MQDPEILFWLCTWTMIPYAAYWVELRIGIDEAEIHKDLT